MKKAFKIIIPILLVLVVITSIAWYLFQYDPDFTRDFLLNQARLAEERGNHSLATWIYDLTYRHSNEDENVAIELAEQFKEMGNYTKAEYTLSNAIADGGTAQLYKALCQTYVEQDKLLDAVTMLDNIADPQIKAELDALRPAAPTATPESGYFNQYVNVAITSTDGDVYISSDGEYPSRKNEPFTGEFPLSGGETTIYAIAVSDTLLVSKLSIFNYTVAGVIEQVSLTDPALNQIVRQKLNVTEDHVLYTNQLWGITELEITPEVKDLSDLSLITFLEQLTIPEGEYENLGTISSLSSLRELKIDGVTLTSENLKAIAALPKLQSLTLSRCNLSGISDLAGATNLTALDLSSNTLQDLSALKEMKELKYLNLSHNAITSLAHLSELKKLEELDVSFNALKTSTELSACTGLKKLFIGNNSLTQLGGIEKLTALTSLYAENNKLTDINHLSTCSEITDLNVSGNAITDLSPISTMPKLKELDFSSNQVAAIPKLASQDTLTSINGSSNLLTSLDALKAQSNLNYVFMEYNSGITSVVPLRECHNLVEVNVYATGVTDVSALTSLNVIVKYSPVNIA